MTRFLLTGLGLGLALELGLLLWHGAGWATLLTAAGLTLPLVLPGLLLWPGVLLLRWGRTALAAAPGHWLGLTLGGLIGLRLAEAGATRLFSALHRPELAGLLLALAVSLPLLVGLGLGAGLGRIIDARLAGGGDPAAPRWGRRAAPLLWLLLVTAWAGWRVLALELLPHLAPRYLLGGGLLIGLLLLEVARPTRCSPHSWAGRAWLVPLLLGLLLPPLGLVAADRLFPSAGAQQLLLEQQTLVGRVVLRLSRAAWDQDGDGASPHWGGGDCDDHDPRRHPAAPDLPGDGVDQDCRPGDGPAGPRPEPLGLTGLARRAPLPPEHPPFRSVLLILVDALRFDATAAGGDRTTMPRLNRLAEQAAVFTAVRATAPGTWPSVPSLLTGRYARDLHWGPGGSPPALAEANQTLPELLVAQGLHTEALVPGYMRWRLPGLGQGFVGFESVLPRDPPKEQSEFTSPLFQTQTERLLRARGLDRLFLYVHFLDPHHPYTVHPGFTRGNSAKERYLGELSYVDHHLGELVETFRTLPGHADTLLVIASDHGEEFGEHRGAFHADQLYEESLHVPLLILGRGIRAGPRSAPVSLLDLFPTLLDLLGQPGPPAEELAGRSLVPDLFDPAGLPPAAYRRPLYAELGPWERKPHRTMLLAENRWKLIHRREGSFELYDLQTDPREQDSGLDRWPARAAELMSWLLAWEQR